MKIPPIGFGTYQLQGKECEEAVRQALALGYRLIDTAGLYQNHDAVGRGLKAKPREELFVITKLWIDCLTPEQVRIMVPRFLDELDMSYIDLLLIHWPNPEVPFATTLDAMLAFREQKLVRHIGVSNFVRRHLKEIASYPIFANQFEIHPYLQRKELVAECKKAKIIPIAHRPLERGKTAHDPVLQTIGAKHNKNGAQVALRWLTQRGIVPIPKASSEKHMRANLEIFDFELDADDMAAIEHLDTKQRYAYPEGITYTPD